ncbi:MAG: protein kinase [Deltaproteobacteria bacterium]|nr:protein kinase [Deltaproteobacteria bacterium]
MIISCTVCQRTFTLDSVRAHGVKQAKCVCGATIVLRDPVNRTKFGKYYLQERLAAGGMGEVLLAKSVGVEGFERDLAIKKILPHLSRDRDFINMLVKEAKLTVLLHHPNIVQVYDLDKEGDEYYIAMEYVPSVNLSMLLVHCADTDQTIPVPVAVSVALQMLQGLSYAHTLKSADGQPMNILHRDITPQNILITKEGWVKITDFGIAKAKNEISTTQPGTIRGKLGYVAPEQLRTKTADQRVDIFSAGIVLWETLAQRRLFKGEDEVDTLGKIVDAKIPNLCKLREDISPQLNAVIQRALARDPDARPISAAAFHDELLAAIQPATGNDYLKESRQFLEAQSTLFKQHQPEVKNNETPTLAIAGTKTSNQGIIAITKLTVPAPHPKRRLVLASLAILLLAAAALVWWKVIKPKPIIQPALTVQEVQAAIDAANESILKCYTEKITANLNPSAQLVIAANGHITDVKLQPGAMSEISTCLNTTLKNIHLRAHPAAKFVVTIKLPQPQKPTVSSAPSNETAEVEHSTQKESQKPNNTPRPLRPLSPEEIQRGVVLRFAAISRCLSDLEQKSAPDTVIAHIVIQANGRVKTVKLTPKLASATVTKCLTKTLKRLRFRAGSKAVEANLPLHLQRYSPDK